MQVQQEQKQINKQQLDVYRGAFLGLKTANLVDPDDIEKYDQVSYNALKAQGLVMCFSLFWTRIYEIGNFKMPVKSRYVFYGLGISIPSFLHAFYVSKKVNEALISFDRKYTPKYYEQYINSVTKQ
ncbi:hypothetical protein ABPG72_003517 [Tetrahymena utriculariae]